MNLAELESKFDQRDLIISEIDDVITEIAQTYNKLLSKSVLPKSYTDIWHDDFEECYYYSDGIHVFWYDPYDAQKYSYVIPHSLVGCDDLEKEIMNLLDKKLQEHRLAELEKIEKHKRCAYQEITNLQEKVDLLQKQLKEEKQTIEKLEESKKNV